MKTREEILSTVQYFILVQKVKDLINSSSRSQTKPQKRG